ncbi:hypothetical protein FGO68_gene10119 [Halteria grandinella]|uniref:Proteinase inhibitor I42 chagasin domain-containing protein n=1 Tax=Halteria grandinella TaxID=5974 RepID=A0A8J8NII2_HALGN|nr:hypothetical protein FGO68_gene10119 [Halteria grandinella]
MQSNNQMLPFRFFILLTTLFVLGRSKVVQVDLSTQGIPPTFPDTLTMQPQDWLKITLEENPSTGYQWVYNVAKIPISERILTLANSEYKESSTGQRNMLGRPGTRVFTFSVNKNIMSGQQEVELIYARSWELEQILLPSGEIDTKNAEKLGLEYYPVKTIVSITSPSHFSTTQFHRRGWE